MANNPPSGANMTDVSTPFSVKGKSAIVTGAGSGINLCFAALLLAKGCNVLFADLSLRPEAQAVVDSYSSSAAQSSDRPRAIFLKTDVTSWLQLDAAFRSAIEAFGCVDIVCPGAGVYDPAWSNFWHPPGVPGGPSQDAVDGDRYASLDINVTHPIRATQLALTHFLNPPAGVARADRAHPKRVLIISSIAGQTAFLVTPIYVAAKHAMNGFIRSLGSLDATLGIRVNGVAPGLIKTPLWTENPEKLKLVDDNKDIWATPEEVAEGMLRCLEEEDLGGGKILEIGAKQTRLVEALNDPGPSGSGHTVSNAQPSYEEIFGWLRQQGWGVAPTKM